MDIMEHWKKAVGTLVELPDGSTHTIGTCLACEQSMVESGPSSDGYLICGKCACGNDESGQRVSPEVQQERYLRVRGRGISWI